MVSRVGSKVRLLHLLGLAGETDRERLSKLCCAEFEVLIEIRPEMRNYYLCICQQHLNVGYQI